MIRGSHVVHLSLEARAEFLPLVTTFVEKGAGCFGLGPKEAIELTLATEEVFMHLCRVVMPTGGALAVRCTGGGYFVEATFSFRGEALDLRAFNLTATVSTEDDAGLDAMGLIIASRFVDRFTLSREKGEEVRLRLIKEKVYPLQEDGALPDMRPLTQYTLRPPQAEEIKLIARLARACYPVSFLTELFLHPGKLVDMTAVDEIQAAAAIGPAGEIGGAMLWRRIGSRMVECFGPYLFGPGQPSDLPEALLESCIAAIARTQTVGLINTHPTPELPRKHFERLGCLGLHCEDGSRAQAEAWLRLMQEDTGSVVWAHPELEEVLRREYRRLVLPREIRLTRSEGESRARHSVFSAEFDRLQSRVTLRPMWPGTDGEENIAQHVKLLRQEHIRNLFFALDMGQAWQAELMPGLLRQGFGPRYILPYAADGDVLVFQHGDEAS